MRLDHPIFHTPNDVQIKLEDIARPDGYRHEAGGAELPPKLKAWKVFERRPAAKGLLEVGLVSDPHGFLDSPDCEWISSGVNSKGPASMAIGRQGNLFLWGFIGDPSQMTDSARQRFVNAICYMKGFDGQRPLVKRNARSREWIPDLIALLPMMVDSLKSRPQELEDMTPEQAAVATLLGASVANDVGTSAADLLEWYHENGEYLREVRVGEHQHAFEAIATSRTSRSRTASPDSSCA